MTGVPIGPPPSTCRSAVRPTDRVGAARAIVLPFGPGRTSTVVHELGHALDDVLGYEWSAKPVSDYGRVDPFEAFAEAFTAWVGLPSYQTERDRLYRVDRETAAFFDAIAWQM
jgi:hypothetical protein